MDIITLQLVTWTYILRITNYPFMAIVTIENSMKQRQEIEIYLHLTLTRYMYIHALR